MRVHMRGCDDRQMDRRQRILPCARYGISILITARPPPPPVRPSAGIQFVYSAIMCAERGRLKAVRSFRPRRNLLHVLHTRTTVGMTAATKAVRDEKQRIFRRFTQLDDAYCKRTAVGRTKFAQTRRLAVTRIKFFLLPSSQNHETS